MRTGVSRRSGGCTEIVALDHLRSLGAPVVVLVEMEGAGVLGRPLGVADSGLGELKVLQRPRVRHHVAAPVDVVDAVVIAYEIERIVAERSDARGVMAASEEEPGQDDRPHEARDHSNTHAAKREAPKTSGSAPTARSG